MSKKPASPLVIIAPKLKQAQKPLAQADKAKSKGYDVDEQAPPSTLCKVEADSFQDDVGAPGATDRSQGRKAIASAEAATCKGAAAGQRSRNRAGSAKEPAAANKKPTSGQQAHPPGGRASHGGVARSSPGAPPPRTGDEIWGLNMQLGRMVEQLADPEDCKQGRRKPKSPKLQEIAHKCWGGTYGEKLDKAYAALDVEEPPAPKYEPPTFLEEEKVADDEEDNSGDDTLRRRHNDTAIAVDKSSDEPHREATASGKSSPGVSDLTAGALPERDVKSAGAAGRRAAAGAAKKPSTAPAAAAAQGTLPTVEEGTEKVQQGLACADAEPDAVANACDGDQGALPKRRAEKAPAARGGGSKAKPAGAAPPPPKTGRSRPAAARRTGRGTAAANAADVAAEDHGDAMDVSPSDAAAAIVTTGPAQSNRLRRSYVPAKAFGSTISKPSLPVPSSAAAAVVSEAVEDVAMSIGEAAGTAPVATKRSRDGAISVDDRLRQNKATRMEQNTAKEVENLKRRAGELESKLSNSAEQEKKLRIELGAAEKRAKSAEQERDREHRENDRLLRDNEKLKADLKERDDKLASLKDELKQLKSENAALKQRNHELEQWYTDVQQSFPKPNKKD